MAHLATSYLEAQSDENTVDDNIIKFVTDVNENLEIIDHNNDCKEVIRTVFSCINNYKKQQF